MQLSLEEKTRVYWAMSSAYNGRTPKPITAEHLFKRVNNTLAELDPQRPLAKRLINLKEEVVKGPEHEDVANQSAKL